MSAEDAAIPGTLAPPAQGGMSGYPKWQGQLSGAPPVLGIVLQEFKRAARDEWIRAAFILGFGWAIISLLPLATRGMTSLDPFLTFLGFLRWPALGVAALMAGTLLDDDKRGALELYLSRSVTRWTYLAGKVLAVLGLTFAVVFGPALVFYGATFFIADTKPDGWAWAILGASGYALIWALVVTGLGLALGCVVRTARAAGILLFAGVAGIDLILGRLLAGITSNENLRVVSPMADIEQQQVWLFDLDPAYAFPWWWGLVALGSLVALGWGVFWARHPRLKGVA